MTNNRMVKLSPAVARTGPRLAPMNRTKPLIAMPLPRRGAAVRALYSYKTAAVLDGQRGKVITGDFDADHIVFLVLSLASWWSSVPQVARMLTGPATEAEHAWRRESVVRAARRLAL